jgi:hypothetical protein
MFGFMCPDPVRVAVDAARAAAVVATKRADDMEKLSKLASGTWRVTWLNPDTGAVETGTVLEFDMASLTVTTSGADFGGICRPMATLTGGHRLSAKEELAMW